MEPLKDLCQKIFNVHDDIRHIVIADLQGSLMEICSRAKYEWPLTSIRDMGGIAAAIVSGIFERTQEYGGNINYIEVNYQKLKLFILQGKDKFFLISTRRKIPLEAVETMCKVVKEL